MVLQFKNAPYQASVCTLVPETSAGIRIIVGVNAFGSDADHPDGVKIVGCRCCFPPDQMFEDACTAIVALKVNGIGPQQAEKFVRLCGGGVGNMVLTKSKFKTALKLRKGTTITAEHVAAMQVCVLKHYGKPKLDISPAWRGGMGSEGKCEDPKCEDEKCPDRQCRDKEILQDSSKSVGGGQEGALVEPKLDISEDDSKCKDDKCSDRQCRDEDSSRSLGGQEEVLPPEAERG